MNYQEYINQKTTLTTTIKRCSLALYILTLIALAQCSLIVFRIDIHFDYISIFLIDSLYTIGYGKMAEGNVIFGAFFYLLIAAIVFILLYASFTALFLEKRRPPNFLVVLIYGADAILWLITISPLQFLLHLLLLVPIVLSMRAATKLDTLESELWGGRRD